ncbi:winged helix-turn-helix transcriptional regulator [Nocardia terpenica]
MSPVNAVKTGLPATLTFRLGYLGTKIADRFAERIAEHDLKPKHVGLLIVLTRDEAASQQELAAQLAVAPSLVVSLADHLERLGAIGRVRDPQDRRRQMLTLTTAGRELLAACERIARALDDEIAAELGAQDRQHLHRALTAVAKGADLTIG